MATYQQLLMNGLNEDISNLINGSQPKGDPGKTAWAWFRNDSGSQPAEVDSYMSSQIGASTVTSDAFNPTGNWATWSSAMNTAFGSATGKVATWLATEYSSVTLDLPTVPDDVITWTKQNLPQAADVIVLGNRAANRATPG